MTADEASRSPTAHHCLIVFGPEGPRLVSTVFTYEVLDRLFVVDRALPDAARALAPFADGEGDVVLTGEALDPRQYVRRKLYKTGREVHLWIVEAPERWRDMDPEHLLAAAAVRVRADEESQPGARRRTLRRSAMAFAGGAAALAFAFGLLLGRGPLAPSNSRQPAAPLTEAGVLAAGAGIDMGHAGAQPDGGTTAHADSAAAVRAEPSTPEPAARPAKGTEPRPHTATPPRRKH